MADKKNQWQTTILRVRAMHDKLGMPVDREIVETVAVLWLLGFNTTGSCSGHVRRNTGGPYVIFQNPKARDYAETARKIKNPKEKTYQNLRTKAERLRAFDLQRMSNYLDDFYQNRPFKFHQHIIVQSMPMTLNILKCHVAELSLVADVKTKKGMILNNQSEMRAFTDYLKALYFAEDKIEKALSPVRL